MIWFFVAIISYFLNAISALVDKFLLKKLIPQPAVYAFYVSVFGLLAFVFAPFDFKFPGFFLVLVGILAGVLFTFAILFFYTSLKKGEVSEIVPIVGGLVPIFIFVLAWLLLDEVLTVKQILAFLIIVFGSYMIIGSEKKGKSVFGPKLILTVIFSAVFFALSHVLMKFLYVHHSFLSGIVWRGIGSFSGALILFLIPKNRKEIIAGVKNPEVRTGFLFFFGQGAAAVSFILLNYAFSVGSVALVSALVGVQYVFLFLMVVVLPQKLKKTLAEETTSVVLWKKGASLALISVGIFILFL